MNSKTAGYLMLYGSFVIAMGLALVVLPGPAFLVIPVGLAILAIEFAWARRWLRKARDRLPAQRLPQPPRSGILPRLNSVRAENP